MPRHANADNDFKCNFCQNGFTTKGNLARHQKNVHNVTVTNEPKHNERPVTPPKQAFSSEDIALLISKLQSGEITSLTDLTVVTRTVPATVVPTLDLGLLLVTNEGLDDDSIEELNQRINDQMLYHIQMNCDFQAIVDDIMETHYDLVFLAVYKNQLYYNDGEGTGSFLTYLDGDRFGEMDATEENVSNLFKLICNAIIHYYVNILSNLRVRLETADGSDAFQEIDRINNLLSQISSCRSVRGNGKIVTDPRSELQSRPTTRSLAISYNIIRPCLSKLNMLLELPVT